MRRRTVLGGLGGVLLARRAYGLPKYRPDQVKTDELGATYILEEGITWDGATGRVQKWSRRWYLTKVTTKVDFDNDQDMTTIVGQRPTAVGPPDGAPGTVEDAKAAAEASP